MKAIDIKIYLDNDVLKIESSSSGRDVGTEWDHNGQVLRFNRPAGFEKYDLMLLFYDGLDPKPKEKNIGTANEYTVTNALTQNNVLHLAVYFFKGNEYRRGTNTLQFNWRKSQQGGSTPEVWVTAKIGTVTTNTLPPGSEATVEVEYVNSELIFRFGVPGNTGGGTSDYEALANKPAINTVEVIGDKDGNDYGLVNQEDVRPITNARISEILNS